MKTIKTVTLLIIILAASYPAVSATEDIWTMGPGNKKAGMVKPGRVEKILEKIADNDPVKAEQLRELQQDDPKAFRKELLEIMDKEMFCRQKGAGPGGAGFMASDKMCSDGNRRGNKSHRAGRKAKHRRQFIRNNKEEFLQWLQTNYPQQALKLQQLKDNSPEDYRYGLMTVTRKYSHLFYAEKNNPQMAAVLKQDIQLKEKISDILQQIQTCQTDNQKQALTTELEIVLNQRFDLIIKRKEFQIQHAQQKLQNLQKRIADKEAAVAELKDKKSQEVQARLQNLLTTQPSEKIDW